MDELSIAKIQNTINEIENQIGKFYIDTPVSKVLMQRAVNQLNQLMTHIGYLESRLELTNINDIQPTCEIDTDWNLSLSHGPDANYLIHGQAIKTLVDHINYLHVLIENCPGNERK